MGNRQILVVDDSVTMQKVIELALAKTSFQITKLADPSLTKSAIQKTQFAAVIINMQLIKGMDPSVVDSLRLNASHQALPLIILTGSFGANQDHALKSLESIYFLQKPFDAKDLTKLLSEVLGQTSASFVEPAAPATSPQVTRTPQVGLPMGAELPIETGRRGRKAFQDDPVSTKTPNFVPESIESRPVAAENPSQPRAGASSFSIPPQELERLVNNYLGPKIEILVKKAVDQYCAEKFDRLAREVIETELRRLATERARHLTDI